MSTRWLKVVSLATPLVGAGYFFGITCQRVGEAYQLLLSPSRELLTLLLSLLLALGLIAMTAGVAAALLRPPWVAFTTFTLSGVALLLGWRMTVYSAILALLYVLAGTVYALSTEGELKQRIKFSVRPVSEGQSILLLVLLIVALASFYLGCADHIKRKGFSIPEEYINKLTEEMATRVAAQAPAAQRQVVQAEIRQQFRRMLNDVLKQRVKPLERFIPLVLTLILFTPLWTIMHLLSWVPMLILSGVFPLLTALGIAKVATETLEVKRLVIS